MHLAHIRDDGLEQTVADHCRNTAQYAADTLKSVHLNHAGYLAGLLHDAGKCQHAFQDYLHSENQKRGSVIHTFQGCRMMLERFHRDGAERDEDLTCELIAYAIGAHHGAFDLVDEHGRSGFFHRMTSEKVMYQEAVDVFRKECADWKEIESLFRTANEELIPVYDTIADLIHEYNDAEELHFYIGLLSRLLLSAVIQGDRRDTAAFMTKIAAPEFESGSFGFWDTYLEHVEEELSHMLCDTPIQKARRSISDQCRAFADQPTGIYRLSVPTGAGKTLSSLRFALAHAAAHRKRRIIFTAPLLTIIDQNAAVIREFIDDDSIILEHHSNVIHSEEDGNRLDAGELLAESWDAPVIITTMVQFLETLFSGKTTSIRRFQALCGSVIVMDEVQTIPNNMLSLFNLAVNFLSAVCDVTFVLCSATQPAFECAEHSLRISQSEMVPYQDKLRKPFERTQIINEGMRRLDDIPEAIGKHFADADNILVICNTKKEAQFIYRVYEDSNIVCLHLSAAMCMDHRRRVLKETKDAIRRSRKGEYKFLLVSTQVIEAGVDISFDCVIRLLAGMDSVVQAAGRCNRNGERAGISPVYLINCSDEKLGNLRVIQDGKTASEQLLYQYRSDPQKYPSGLLSDASIRQYYLNLYRQMPIGYQDDSVEDGKDTLLSLLSSNCRYVSRQHEDTGKYLLSQAFRTAGRLFQVFDTDTTDVIVPYGDGRELITQLLETNGYDAAFLHDWLQKAKPFTVSLYQNQIDRIGAGSVIEKYGVSVLSDGWYDEHIGFTTEQGISGFMEV